jgi:hypothetical protein
LLQAQRLVLRYQTHLSSLGGKLSYSDVFLGVISQISVYPMEIVKTRLALNKVLMF